MSHDHHNHNGHSEKKSVAFGTPLILGVVTVFIILCFVSLGNPCHGKCCDEGECKKECAEKCEKDAHGTKDHKDDHSDPSGNDSKDIKVPVGANVADSTQTDPHQAGPTENKKEEEHKEEAHH